MKKANYIFAGLSLLFILDFVLPNRQVESTIIASYYTTVNNSSSSTRISSSKTYFSNITLETTKGRILVHPFGKYNKNQRFKKDMGEEVILHKTMLFGISQKIRFYLNNHEVKTSKPAYNALIFFPFIFFFVALLIFLTRNDWIILNIGSLNLVLVLIYLILVFTNVGNISLNEY